MAKEKRKSKYAEGQHPWRDVSTFAGGPGQKWTFWASIVVLAIVVPTSAYFLFAPRTNDQTAAVPAATTAPHSPQPEEWVKVCPEKHVDDTATAVPKDLEWTAQVGTSWPISAGTGPTKTVNGIAQCFDRSPAGAALAAVNMMQSLRVADIDGAHAILDAQFLPGEGRDAIVEVVDEIYPDQAPQSREWGRQMGFKVLSFSADEARVLLVENWPQRGQYTGYPVTLSWVDGDWRIVLDPSGNPSPNGSITVDPDSFTPWEASK